MATGDWGGRERRSGRASGGNKTACTALPHCTAAAALPVGNLPKRKKNTRERESESKRGWAGSLCLVPSVRVFLLLLGDAMAEGQEGDWSEEEAERFLLRQGGATGGAGRREGSKKQIL